MCAVKKSGKARKPARSELGEIVYETGTFEFDGKDWGGKPVKQKKPGIRFWLRAVGPNGVYTAKISRPFEGKQESNRTGWYVVWSEAGRDALNELIQDLWKDGWQPSSIGRFWHQFSFRKMVEEPSDPESDQEEDLTEITSRKAKARMSSLLESFRKVEATYAAVRADLAAARINPDQYRAQLENLRVQETSERWWKIDGQSGKWLLWDGKTWKAAEPPFK
jgi:hypothetical protein